jgi:hypothetical protein
MILKLDCRSVAGRVLLTLTSALVIAFFTPCNMAWAAPTPAHTQKEASARAQQSSESPAQAGKCEDGLIHTAKRGEAIGTIARHYIDQTSYLTLGELETAIRQANGMKSGNFFKPGQKLIIPGILKQPIVEHPIPVPRDFEARGIYLTGWVAGSEHGLGLIRRWRQAGGNAVVFDVKDMGGDVHVPFKNPLSPEGPPPTIRNLPKFVHFLHSLQLHAIARIALFRDGLLAVQDPALDPVSIKTGKPWAENGKQVWVDPSLAKVQDYNLALAKYVAEAGVDEIQFDYVRFPAEGDQKDVRFAYEKDHPKWQRSDVIVGFLKRAYAELHPTGVLVSLDVFGVMAWQRPKDLSRTGQNIPEMSRYCDVLSPMVYPSHFFGMDGIAVPGDAPEHFVSESMDRFRQVTAGTNVVLRPWLQAFGWRTPDYSPAYIIVQVSAARQAGGVGFLFWNARNDYAKVFPAMATMGAAGKQYFRGDEVGSVRPKSSPSPSAEKTSESTAPPPLHSTSLH